MLQIFGLLLVLAMVFGGYALAGGDLDVLLQAGPAEFVIIGGAGLGTILIASGRREALGTLAAPWRAVCGPRWRQADHADLARVLRGLFLTLRRQGVLALEQDIEAPHTSERFQDAPALQRDGDALDLIQALVRRAALGPFRPGELDQLLDRHIGRAAADRRKPTEALMRLADALPALGIVAAVLGVIKSMAAIDQSGAVLGGMIASALVGTFLGVFLAYGFVSPLAARYGDIVEADLRALDVIADSFEAHFEGASSEAAVARGVACLPPDLRPDPADIRVVPLTQPTARTG